eukprot:CAMPEP_0185744952 /NCGR_PEP_ID=MMETSP1174-20130828/3223_1 /TAXON_ID=35687 /ORGANISM="Dictyocha speculum, Strain CCMP1381" /LENGTH=46 /DNA_ID= /DNA_START= /DNA_END= /DNA_ORIENTATION=
MIGFGSTARMNFQAHSSIGVRLVLNIRATEDATGNKNPIGFCFLFR